MDLYELIEDSRSLLSRFDYDHYPEDFQEFSKKCVPFFGSLEEEEGESAEDVLSSFEAHYSELSRGDRREAVYQDKQVLALYFSPAARAYGGAAEEFAKELQKIWNETYPKENYELGDYEAILKGFDANLLGVPLRKSKKRWWL
ncbi:MAG: hypothetical protein IIZ33_08295 [Erysipelotrichaceae bacterium]|nr:hypothetical protein [Erysipelotrichaceae bacterium]